MMQLIIQDQLMDLFLPVGIHKNSGIKDSMVVYKLKLNIMILLVIHIHMCLQ